MKQLITSLLFVPILFSFKGQSHIKDSYISNTPGTITETPFQNEDIYQDNIVTEEVAESGKRILENTGCIACHSFDGTKLVGETFKGLYGKNMIVIEGSETVQIVADDEYISRSIFDPGAQITEGYAGLIMPSYRGLLDEEDVAQIIEYLKTLQE